MNLAAGRISSIVLATGLTFAASGASAAETCATGTSDGSLTLGTMFCNVHSSTLGAGIALLLALCFVGGLFLFYKAARNLIDVTDGKSQAGFGSALMPLAAGTFLIALPTTIAIGLGTITGGNTAWNIAAQDEVGNAGMLEADNVMSMIGNFAINAAGPLSTLVMGLAVLIGIALVASSMFGLAKMSDSSQQAESPAAIGARFFVGICLVNIFWLMDMIGGSFGLENLQQDNLTKISNLAYTAATQAQATEDVTARFNYVIDIAFMALIPFGLMALVRGMLILKDAADQRKQQAGLGAGLTHIVGGIALVNAKVVSCAVMKTLAGAASFCPGS